MAWTLVLAALVDTAIALTLLHVGNRVARRPASPEAARAQRAFGVWWAGLALTVLSNAAREAAVAAGAHDARAVVAFLNAFQYVYVVALVAAVWGLLYYLVYLFTGNPAWFWPLAGFYAAYGAVGLWLIARMGPAGVTPGKWFVQWAYADPQAGGALLVVLTLLLLLPQLGAAVAYLSLVPRLDDAPARYRVQLVSWSLIVWLGVSLVAPFLGLGRYEWWSAGGRLVGFTAALVIHAAYFPPRAIRERLEERGVA